MSAADRSRYDTLGLLAGLFLLSTAAAAYEIAPASVLPVVRSTLDIGPTAAGWLVSVMYATAVLTSVPVGVVLDRTSIHRVVTIGGIALLVAGGWGWYAATVGAYWWLLLSRVLGGIAYVLFWNAGANTVGRAVGPERRATAVGVFTASAPVGFTLGQFGSPLIATRLGWPAILPAFAAIAALGVGLFALATRGRSIGTTENGPDREGVRSLLSDRSVWILCVLCFLAYAVYLAFNTWMPSYLVERFDVSLAASGLFTALLPAVGIVARSSGGVLSDRLFGRRRRPVAIGAFALAAPAVISVAVVSRVGPVIGSLVVIGFAVQVLIGLLFSYITEIVAADVRATAVSMLTSVGLFGAFVGPIVVGEIVDRAGYRPAFLFAGGGALLGIVLAWRAPEPGE